MHLSVVPQNRFGDLVEAALRVEQSTTAMYQSRQESKRSASGTSQQSFGQYSKKRNKGKGYRGRGAGRGAAPRGGRSSGLSFPLCSTCQRWHLGECRMNMTGCFHCRQEGHFIRNCPQLVVVETSKIGTVASTPSISGPSQAGRGGSGRGGSTTTSRGRGRGAGGRGSTPIGQIQSGIRTQARVFSVTQQEEDASLDVITGMISVYDHDAYALVDPGATHSFISVPFTERHQIES